MSPNSKEPQKQLDYIKDYLQDMMTYKTNKMYNDYSQGFVEDRWKETLKNQVFKDFYKELGEFLRKTGVGYLAFVIHPYLHFSYEMHVKDMDKEQQYYFLHSREEDNQTLIDIIKIAMDAGARTVMLMSDDFVPHEGDYQKIYSLWTPEDKKKFISLQYAQAYTINKVYDFLAQNYPNSRLEFCPPYYLNEFVDKTRGYAEAYFRDLIALIPQDVAIVWTGNTVRSLSFDMADIKRFKDLIGRYPMLWDNTLYARSAPGIYGGYPAYYPGKSKMCNIFEPFDVDLPKDFYKYNDGYEIYMNNLFNEVYRFKNATTADYHWNNNAYNPDFSLWKVMLRRVGKEKAIKLIDFNDAFYHSMQAVVQIEYTGDTQKWQKIAEKYLTNLNTLTNDLAVMFSSSPKLVEELKEHNNYLTNRYAESLKGTNIKKEGLEQIR